MSAVAVELLFIVVVVVDVLSQSVIGLGPRAVSGLRVCRTPSAVLPSSDDDCAVTLMSLSQHPPALLSATTASLMRPRYQCFGSDW